MKAEIISVGTELLLGNILNTDTKYLAEKLRQCGVSCYRQSVVGDNIDRLAEEIANALPRCDILLVTGGLGPTADDITRYGVAKALGLSLVRDAKSEEHIKDYFRTAGKEWTENNLRQADFPVGAEIFENRWGTANAFAVKAGSKTVYVLPGPPRELQPMADTYLVPRLQGNEVLVRHQVRLFGIWESAVEEKLIHLTRDLQNPTVGIYASCGEVLLQVTARAESEEKGQEMCAPVVQEICDTMGTFVYGVDVPSLEQRVLNLLKDKKKTLSTAESCTGGLVAKRITDLSGASSVFGYGFVTYANEAKEKLIGVSAETLQKFGVVSKETAVEMAEGARKASGSDIAVALTGIAGPDGGTKEKPVGTVFVAVTSEKGTTVSNLALYRMGADRAYIRQYASSYALNEVRKVLE